MIAEIVFALLTQSQAQAMKPEPAIAKTVCKKTAFASVDPKETESLIRMLTQISSVPYQVEVVEKKETYDVVRITHSWKLTKKGPPELVNPGFAERVHKVIEDYKPQNVWTEARAMKYCD